jgi:hypothetical protein
MALDDVTRQIEAGLSANHFYLALFTSLTLPDIAAALESPDGRSSKARYVAWFDAHVASKYMMGGVGSTPPYVGLTGDDCYGFRCSMLHQGRAEPHGSHGSPARYERIVFVEPDGRGNVYRMISELEGRRVLMLDVATFCTDLVASFRAWLPTVAGTEPYQTNATHLVQRRPHTVVPGVFFAGVNLIG